MKKTRDISFTESNITNWCFEHLLKKTDNHHPSICIRVDQDDYRDFLGMCKENGCTYKDGTDINPDDTRFCNYLMEVGNDYRIIAKHGVGAMKLQECWHFRYSDIKKGLYLAEKCGCLDLSDLSGFDGNNFFMNEAVNSIVLPVCLTKDVNRLFKGTDYKGVFYIYFCGNYEQTTELIKCFEIDELAGKAKDIRVISYGGDCKDNIKYSYDKLNGFISRWIWGKRMLPELIEERQITNSILVPDGNLYMYRSINPDSVIYRFVDAQIRGTSYKTQICLHDEKHMLPKIELYLKDIDCRNYVFIRQGEEPNQERAYLVDLETDSKQELGSVNYIDKSKNLKYGISIATKNEKLVSNIPLEALSNYSRLHREYNYIFFNQETKEFTC